MKKNNKHRTYKTRKMALIGIILVAIALIVSLLFFMSSPGILGDTDGVRLAESRTNSEFHMYLGKPKRPHLGTAENIPLIMVSGECATPLNQKTRYLQLRLNQAFRVKNIADMWESYKPDSSYPEYLVIQGWARNPLMTETGIEQTMHPEKYFRLRRGNDTHLPFTQTYRSVPLGDTRIFWIVFPVSPSETAFNVEYCLTSDPAHHLLVDFMGDATTNISGNFSIQFGLFLAE